MSTEHAEFWSWCERGELRLQRCAACGAWRFHPKPRCPSCRSPEASWEPVSGRGAVYTYTISHPPVLPTFADRVPYNAVVVQLDEGPFMVSNLVDCDDAGIEIGMPVEVTFDTGPDGRTLPYFRPAGPPAG